MSGAKPPVPSPRLTSGPDEPVAHQRHVTPGVLEQSNNEHTVAQTALPTQQWQLPFRARSRLDGSVFESTLDVGVR